MATKTDIGKRLSNTCVLKTLNIHPASFVRCGIFITFVSRMSNLVLTITQETKINGKNDIKIRPSMGHESGFIDNKRTKEME